MARTPRMAPQCKFAAFMLRCPSSDAHVEGSAMMKAGNLRNMSATPTPLLGDENMPVQTLGSVSSTPPRTPLRDNPSVCPEGHASAPGQTPRDMRIRKSLVNCALKAGLMCPPNPKTALGFSSPTTKVLAPPLTPPRARKTPRTEILPLNGDKKWRRGSRSGAGHSPSSRACRFLPASMPRHSSRTPAWTMTSRRPTS